MKISHPHPFRKGRGGYTCILASEGAVMLVVKPTSLNGGEGLISGLAGEIGGVRARARVVERWWMKKTNEDQQ